MNAASGLLSSSLFSNLSYTSPALQACIIIPARDEADSIECTLDAIFAQHDLEGNWLSPELFEILLLCNNCRDETADIARAWGKEHPQIALHIIEAQLKGADANIGTARRLLMDAACARLMSLENDGLPRAICSTDADTRVHSTWVAAILDEMERGADAVGGRILVAKNSDSSRATYLRDTAYRLYCAHLENQLDAPEGDAWPRHFQFFGASMAISPRAYEIIGGLPRVTCLEDMRLERELRRHNFVIRHAPNVWVTTSARMGGRVAMGLSTQLNEWAHLGDKNKAWLVPSGKELATRFEARRALRAAFAHRSTHQGAEVEKVASDLRLNPRWLRARLERASSFGALWDDVEFALNANPLFRAQWPAVPVEMAIEELRMLLSAPSVGSAPPVGSPSAEAI